MTTDELESLLRAWGRVYGEKPPAEWDGDVSFSQPEYGTNPIARGMEFAPGKRVTLIRQRTNMDRGGYGRRTTLAMAANSGLADGRTVGLRVVAAAFVDPVPCVETRSHRSAARDWPVPPELQRVQRAALDLIRVDTLRGLCLRIHYCTRGSLEDKASDAALRLGNPLKVRMYRDAVSHARTWVHARIAA